MFDQKSVALFTVWLFGFFFCWTKKIINRWRKFAIVASPVSFPQFSLGSRWRPPSPHTHSWTSYCAVRHASALQSQVVQSCTCGIYSIVTTQLGENHRLSFMILPSNGGLALLRQYKTFDCYCLMKSPLYKIHLCSSYLQYVNLMMLWRLKIKDFCKHNQFVHTKTLEKMSRPLQK